MKVKVRNQIRIGGHRYTIRLDKSCLADSQDRGQVNHRTLTILINQHRPDSQRREALLHEILHVINWVYMSGDVEERVIKAFAEGLNQFFDEMEIELDWSEIKSKE